VPNVVIIAAASFNGQSGGTASAGWVITASTGDTLGLSTLEANACGTPVVAADVPPFDQTIGPENGARYAHGDLDAMAEAIENQPFCESVTVEIDDDRVGEAIDHENGYTELTGSLMTVEMRIDYEGVTARTRMAMEDGYPLMKLLNVDE